MQGQPAMSSLSLASKLAVAGIVGPIVFTMTVIPQSVFQPDYSDLALPVSALAAWPLGWVQDLNFIVFGSLMTLFAVGLHLGISPSRKGSLGPALLVLSGMGIILAGAFPWRQAGGDFVVPVGHRLGAVLAFAGAGLGLVATGRRMLADPKWRKVARLALGSGITMTVLFLVISSLAVRDTAPLRPWAGLLQRMTLAVWFPCTIVLALHLRRVTRAAETLSGQPPH